jgi:hypothetical protein
MIEERDIERAIDYLRDSAEQAAQARAERAYMEQWLKSLRSTLMLGAPGTSVADREAYAMAHHDYQTAINALRSAVEADERYRFLREAADAKIRAWQTQCSNERATRI